MKRLSRFYLLITTLVLCVALCNSCRKDDGIAIYTVTFECDGGSEIASQSVELGNSAVQPTAPTKEGSVFAGWCSDANLTKEYNFSSSISANTTIYAKWVVNVYAVYFNMGGGTAIAPQSVDHGSTITLPTTSIYVGHYISGWYTDPTLSLAWVEDTPITETTTLYAKWDINIYTVSFEMNGGATASAQSIAYGYYAVEPTIKVKTDHVFEGWYTDEALTQAWDFSTPITADIKIYAKWIAL